MQFIIPRRLFKNYSEETNFEALTFLHLRVCSFRVSERILNK